MAYCRHSNNSKNHPLGIADKQKKKLKLILMQRSIFTVFRSMINASYSGTKMHVDLLFPRISIIIIDQPEEKALLCLKGRDS